MKKNPHTSTQSNKMMLAPRPPKILEEGNNPNSNTAARAKTPPRSGNNNYNSSSMTRRRVWGLTFSGSHYRVAAPIKQWEAALWRALDTCTCMEGIIVGTAARVAAAAAAPVVVAHPRSTTMSKTLPAPLSTPAKTIGEDKNTTTTSTTTPTPLSVLNINFRTPIQSPLLRRLISTYPALTRRLTIIRIVWNEYDESGDLGALVVLAASHLQELTLQNSGLTSLRGLLLLREIQNEGSIYDVVCDAERKNNSFRSYFPPPHISLPHPPPRLLLLRKVDFSHCTQLTSLDGIQSLAAVLEEIHIVNTAVTSVRELRWCSALRSVNLCWCQALTSLEGLGHHHKYLKEVVATNTAITSVEPLGQAGGCPALTTVYVDFCSKLVSLRGLLDLEEEDEEEDTDVIAENDMGHTQEVHDGHHHKHISALEEIYARGSAIPATTAQDWLKKKNHRHVKTKLYL